MAYWLHSTLGPPELHADEAQARAALERLVAKLRKQAYRVDEVSADHYRLTHPSRGFVEAYIDTQGTEIGGDDET
jgi:hypothetical protein